MDEFLIFILIIYVLSPIPLLVLFLVRNHAANSAKKALAEKNKECQKLLRNEEEYRAYICQLQNQLKAADPDAKIGALQDQPAQAPQTTTPQPQAFPAFSTPKAPAPAPSVAPAMPSPTPLSATSAPTPLPAPANRVQPLPAASYLRLELSAPLPVPAAPTPVQAKTVPTTPAPAATPATERNHTPWILTTGVLLLLLASVGFISATWSMLTIGIRAICLLSFSAIFLGAGIIARTKLKLQNTSIAFYSIGSAALPITIIGSGAFGLLGKHFTLEFPMLYNTLLVALCSLMVLLFFGAAFFRSRVFAAGALSCASLSIYTLARMLGSTYQLNVLIVSLFASATILLVPLAKKIPENSRFHCFSKVFEIYAIVNIYFMCVAALFMSKYCIWSGIILVLFAAAFLAASVLRKETGLMSLPSVLLLLVGTMQIVKPDSEILLIVWFLIIGICYLALSYVGALRKVLRYVFFGFGLTAMLVASFAIFDYTPTTSNYAFIPMTLIAAGTMIFLSIQKKHPLLFAGSLLSIFTFFWGICLHCFVPANTSTSSLAAIISAMVISGLMFILFSFIPHHRFFTTTGNIFLFLLFTVYSIYLSDELPRAYDIPVHFIVTFALVIFCLVSAYRKDRLNYRKPDTERTPRSITVMRCFYASIWPLIFTFSCLKYILMLPESGYSVILPIMILLCFAYIVIFVQRSGTAGILAIPHDYDKPESGTRLQTLSRNIAFFACMVMGFIAIHFYAYMNAPDISGAFAVITFVLTHLFPLLIPATFILLASRMHKISKLPLHDNLAEPARIFWFRLLGLLTASICLPYTLMLFKAYNKKSDLYVPGYELFPDAPRFLFSATFFYSIVALLASLYFLVLYLRKDRSSNIAGTSAPASTTAANDASPLSRLFGKKLSSWQMAWFVWMLAFTAILFIARFADRDLHGNLLFAILLGMTLLCLTVLFEKHLYIVSFASAALLTIHYLGLLDHFFGGEIFSAWLIVLLMQLPTLAFCFAALFRSRTNDVSDERTSITRTSFFWNALIAQSVVFLAVPFLTENASRHFANFAYSVRSFVSNAHVINDIAGLFPHSIARSRLIAFTIPGFLLVELAYLLRSKTKTSGKRAIALILVTLSCLVWMPVLRLPSLSALIEQAYLLPCTVFVVLLPWILPKKEHSSLKILNLVYSCVAMGILALIALISDDLFSLIFFGIVSVLVLLLGYFMKKKPYIILGTVCTLGMLAYIANRVWGSMAWWIYLFVTGGVLVTIAVRNEIKKRS